MTVHTEIGNPLITWGMPTGLFIDTGELVPCATECRNSPCNNAWLHLNTPTVHLLMICKGFLLISLEVLSPLKPP